MLKSREPSKKTYEPLYPYIASTYNTLCSVAQGTSLGALLYVLSNIIWNLPLSQEEFSLLWVIYLNLPIILECCVVITLIALIWHRYVVQNQFSRGRRLGRLDTLIPIMFAVLQSCLALTLLSKEVYWFSLVVTVITALGVLAHFNVLFRFKSKKFKLNISTKSSFDRKLQSEVYKFQWYSIFIILSFTVLFSLITYFNHHNSSLSEEFKIYITSLFSIIAIYIAFYYDLEWYLKHSIYEDIRRQYAR